MSSEIIGELGQVGLTISETRPTQEGGTCQEISETVPQTPDSEKKRSPKSIQYSYRTKRFRSEWMTNDIFKDWLRPHSCPEFAVCAACNRVIKAGKSELEKHASGKKHIKMLKLNAGVPPTTTAVPPDPHQGLVLVGQQDPQQNPYSETTFVVNLTENGAGESTGYSAGASGQYVEVTQYEAQPTQTHVQPHTQNHVHSHTQTHVQTQPQVPTVAEQTRSSQPIRSHLHQTTTEPTSPPSQQPVSPSSPLKYHVMKAAPHWKATAVVNGHVTSLDLNDYKGRYLIMLFYTHDFCKVSCSEVNSVSDAMGELRALGAEAVACSVDSYLCHLTWYKMTRLDNGVQGAKVALLSDPTHIIAINYGVYIPEKGHALRACFIIDKNGIIRHMAVSDPSIGRGTSELIRLLRAIQHNDRTEETCYADWRPND